MGRNLDQSQSRLERHTARLSSGLRINSARDDAAGLAMSSRLQARIRGMAVDLRSLNDLTSLVQVADSALGNISENLQRIRELSIQAANGSSQLADRQSMQFEVDQLIDASRKFQSMTEFNGKHLLDGSFYVDAFDAGGGNLPNLYIPQLFLPKTTSVLLRYAQLSQASTTTTPTGAIQTGDLVINRKAIPASQAGTGPGENNGSAWSIANAINQAGITGLTAVGNTSVTGDFVLQPNGGSVIAGEISINGIPVGAGNVVSAINGISGQTGVTAASQAGTPIAGPPIQTPYRIVMTARDGRDISIAGAGGFGINDASEAGSVSIVGPLEDGGNFVIAGANPGNAGLASGVIFGVDVGDPVPIPLTEEEGYDFNPDVMSEETAQVTIGVMDRKFDKLVAIRTRLGAMLSVFDARRNTLSESRTAASATRSRLEETDYAQELAALTKEKILQNYGVAINVQANAESRRVLMLLTQRTGFS
jgi:flagellin